MLPFLLLLLLITTLTLNCQPNPTPSPSSTPHSRTLTGQPIIQQLDSLHFFDLTPPEELTATQQAFLESKEELNYFGGKLRGESLDYTDGRFFWIDAEELFEVGGLVEYLEKVQPSFEKLGLQLEYSQEKDAPTALDWHHTIVLNGTTYTAFEGNFSDKDWVIAYTNFIEMLNDQLTLQGNANQFYPIKADNDGLMVLLTPAQFQVVQAHYPRNGEHPKSLEEWKKEYGL